MSSSSFVAVRGDSKRSATVFGSLRKDPSSTVSLTSCGALGG